MSSKFNIQIISAGAGSGKTYRLTNELSDLVADGGDVSIRPSGIIGTTFTRAAAAELKERVREKLIEKGMPQKANELLTANIGTVNSVCGKLLESFCYEAGLPPTLMVIEEEQQQVIFSQALAQIINRKTDSEIWWLSGKFGYNVRMWNGNTKNWKDDVKRIVEKARNNKIKTSELAEHATKSIDELLSHLPSVSKKTPEQFNKDMIDVIDWALAQFEASSDVTKKTQGYVSSLKQFKGKLVKNRASYGDWGKLTKSGVCAVKSSSIEDKVIDQASMIESHPELHSDLRTYITRIYEIAAQALDAYEDYKARRGLIDFIDQEERVLDLLDNPDVVERLKEDLDLLLVDEFQDTSPIQLAIFLKLSKLVKKTIWVGDPKQCIYAFRGADPGLMLSMVEELGGVKPEDIQDTSYRSRTDLVEAVNTLFKEVFPFDEEQIVLKPNRPELTGLQESIELWKVKALTKDESDGKRPWGEDAYLQATAHAIKDLIANGREVVDKDSEKARPMRPGDIAVLLRSNDACELMAGYLEQEGLRVAMERDGLLGTSEGAFLHSCLSLIINPYDSLARAEVQVFTLEGSEVAEVFNDRLKYLEGDKEKSWAEGHAWVSKLIKMSEEVGESSASEVIDRLLIELNFREYTKKWGQGALRSANIDQFRLYAVNYENECKNLGAASTLAGFLIWLSSAEKLKQAAGTGVDAVNVMTYHKSKGLEWPVVVCGQLDNGAWAGFWGSSIVDPRTKIDMDNPLSERWIKTWVNPATGGSLPFIERLKKSPLNDELYEQSLAENARLLYVGMTRARDYMILASRKFDWMDQLIEKTSMTVDFDIDSQGKQELPWNAGINMHGKILKMHPPEHYAVNEIEEESVLCLKDKKGRGEFEDLYLSPSSAEGDESPFKGEMTEYGERLDINEKIDADIIGTALHNLVALGESVTENQIERTLSNFGMTGAISVKDAKEKLSKFEEHLKERWSGSIVHRELPIRMMKDGQIINGIVDMLVEEDDGLILIDHKSYQGGKDKLAEKAGYYRPQLEMYKDVLEATFGKPVKESYINFLVSGSMVEMGA